MAPLFLTSVVLLFAFTSSSFSQDAKSANRQEQKYEQLQLTNGEIMQLSPEDAAGMSKQALEMSADMIDESDDETKSALQKAAEELNLKLPTKQGVKESKDSEIQ